MGETRRKFDKDFKDSDHVDPQTSKLRTRATLDSPWELIPGSGTMMAVAAQPDPERHHADQD